MTVLLAPRYVEGEPAWLHVPPGAAGTDGETAAGIAELMGRPPEPHQRAVLDAINSYGPDGNWLTLECCVIGPRQTTGKTSTIVLPSVIADMWTWEKGTQDKCSWSSHRMKTTLDTFKSLKNTIENVPEFADRTLNISEKDGDESITWFNGSELQFGARSDGAGRGLGNRIVVLDEWLFGTGAMAGDLLPTMVAFRNPHVFYASSAPKSKSDHLQRLVQRGREGDPDLTYAEYRCPGSLAEAGCLLPQCDHERGVPGCQLDDRTLWRIGSPGLVSGRVSVNVVRALRKSLSPLEFAREMLGWEEPADAGTEVISSRLWARRVDELSRVRDGARPVFAFDVAPERRSAAVGICGPRADGGTHVGLVDHRAGADWLLERLLQLVKDHRPRALVVAGDSPAASLIPDLRNARIRLRSSEHPRGLLVVTSSTDMGRACGGLIDAVQDPASTLWHRGDKAVAKAWESSEPRLLGDGAVGISRKRSGGDVCPAVAVTLAHYGHVVTPVRDPLDNLM